eukprot:jgi/Hompol1/2215/HPOL_001646-RA
MWGCVGSPLQFTGFQNTTSATRYLTSWANIEHQDIKDICDRTREMLDEFQTMILDFQLYNLSDGYGIYRDKLKEINKQTETLHALQHKHKQIQDRLSSAVKNKKPHEALQSELASTERDLQAMVADFESQKRLLLKEALDSQFDAFVSFGKEMTVLGAFGKFLSSQIPQGKLSPGQELPMYKGQEVTKRIFADFSKELKDVRSRAQAKLPRSETIGSLAEKELQQSQGSLNASGNKATAAAERPSVEKRSNSPQLPAKQRESATERPTNGSAPTQSQPQSHDHPVWAGDWVCNAAG